MVHIMSYTLAVHDDTSIFLYVHLLTNNCTFRNTVHITFLPLVTPVKVGMRKGDSVTLLMGLYHFE
jgi:hypothetical protein